MVWGYRLGNNLSVSMYVALAIVSRNTRASTIWTISTSSMADTQLQVCVDESEHWSRYKKWKVNSTVS